MENYRLKNIKFQKNILYFFVFILFFSLNSAYGFEFNKDYSSERNISRHNSQDKQQPNCLSCAESQLGISSKENRNNNIDKEKSSSHFRKKEMRNFPSFQ